MKKYHDQLLRNIWDLTEDKSSPIAQEVLKSSALPFSAYRDVEIRKFSYLSDIIHNMRDLINDGYSIVDDDIQVMLQKFREYYNRVSYRQLRLPKEFYDELVAAFDEDLSYSVMNGKLNALDKRISEFLATNDLAQEAYRKELGLSYTKYDVEDQAKWDVYSEYCRKYRFASLWKVQWLLHRVQRLVELSF